MINFGERDPEEVGPEHPEDTELRHRVMEARHEFIEGENGKCIETLVFGGRICGADSWSVMHIDDRLDNHDHGGGDCMCFEGEY
jgi:hypothetical protein